MRQLPEWWSWPFLLTPHVELRTEERGLDEVVLRSLLDRPVSIQRDRDDVRWRTTGREGGTEWTVVLEPDPSAGVVYVITVFRR